MMPRRFIPVTPAHSFLRRATRRQHKHIDESSVLTVLTNPGLTMNLYRIAMQSLHRAYREIDSVLLDGRNVCPAAVPPYSPRLPSIERDLIALNVQISDDASRHPRPCSGLKAPDTEATYLGMRYVVEGAQLGSRVIHGHLATAFGDELQKIGSFWTPGSDLQSSWPHVLKSLARVNSRESLACAGRAARITFRHMDVCLAENHTAAT